MNSVADTTIADSDDATPAYRILVVEDHKDTLALLTRLLSRSGFQVISATGVADALSLAESQTFDLLISDLLLWDGTGWDLCHQLSQKRSFAAIALSGLAYPADIDRSRRAGFCVHLTKPVDFPSLVAAVRQCAAERRTLIARR
jgi:CheY-like chemotaxis protein